MDRSPVYAAWKPLRSTRNARRRFRWSDLFLAPSPEPKRPTLGKAGSAAPRQRPWIALLLIFAVVLGGGVLAHAQSSTAATTNGPRRIMSGWLPYWGTQAALNSVTANADLFADASPFWYTLGGDGQVRKSCDSCTTDSRIAEIVQALHSRKIPVLPTITQGQDAPQMASFLADAGNRAAHVRQIVGLVTDHGYAGIDLDYESMAFGGTVTDRIAVKQNFAQLAQELAQALHARGKKLSITVGARTSTSDYGNWSVYDYAALGQVADKFRIMTYDYGWSGGPVNPVAPFWWVDSVLAHATTLVPSGKIWLGIPSYGYDWREGAVKATALSYDKARTLQAQFGARREWVETDGSGRLVRSPKFTYRDSKGGRHTVWYNDSASMRQVMGLVGAYQLGGAALWSLGTEDPGLWEAARSYATSIAVASTTAAVWTSARTLRYGTTLRIKGRLTDAGGQLIKGRAVSLQQRNSTTSGWTTIGKANTDTAGQVSFRVSARRGQQVRLVAGGTWASAGATSVIKSVAVSRSVSSTTSVSRHNAVSTLTTRGAIFPAAAGVQVSQQRLENNRWVTVSSSRTDAAGRYRVALSTRSLGSPTVRVHVSSAGAYQTGASRPQRVTLR